MSADNTLDSTSQAASQTQGSPVASSPAQSADVAPKLPGMPSPAGDSPLTAEDVKEALREVIDPELGINVVDLGLLYGLNIDGADVVAEMTLTSAACPLTDVIEEQASLALEGQATSFRIEWVWLPPWGPERITPEGREQLRALGFNV